MHLTDFEEINLTDEFIIYQTSEGKKKKTEKNRCFLVIIELTRELFLGEACALWLFEKKDRERILAKILK